MDFTIISVMGRNFFITIALVYSFSIVGYSQYIISGKVVGPKNKPVPFAAVSIPASGLWATANAKGAFTLSNVPAGNTILHTEYLGYATKEQSLMVSRNIANLVISLREDNLALEDVVVTGQKSKDLTTSYLMDHTALDHMQMLNVTDVASLLPGGKTNRNLHLATGKDPQAFSVNGTGGEMGNALFGVAVEVDGVRLSNNGIPGMEGTDTRNIASSNVESIEIVTGIPSVEYGDLTNGLVKINTRKGKSPFILEMMTKPSTKQVSLSKGLELGPKSGVLSMNIEHTKSISDLASPYTSYDRNGLSLNYSNTFNRQKSQPITLDLGISGNLGGYDSKSDPDLLVNTYTKMKDNAIRANFSVKWLLHKTWITNVEASGSLNYNNRLSESSTNNSASSSVAAIHATEEGYHIGQTYDQNPNADIILIQPGYWYQLQYNDSKLINYTGRIKANWFRKLGQAHNNLLLGGEYTLSGNNGQGEYYADMRYAPTWRPYRYDQVPKVNNYSIYAEDRVYIPIHQSSSLQVVGGLRSDITSIKGSQYGTASNLSPRFNALYTFWEGAHGTVKNLSVKIGWGKEVKLPSFSVLYPEISYRDILTFAPGTTSDGQTFYAYYTMPNTSVYNPNLKWQYNIQNEISVNTNIAGTKISITAGQDKTYHSYASTTTYTPFTYKLTDQSNLEGSAIPIANRIYTVDKATGIVTVTDNTGALPAETLSYKEITRARYNSMATNGSSVTRRRLSWIVDFEQIAAIKTTFRLDGNYYYYKGIEQTVTAYMPNWTLNMADGNPYKYIGFYVGGANAANGSLSRAVNMNLTATTHIPALRLILSARVEGSLYDYSHNLSQYSNGQERGFVLDDNNQYTPSATLSGIYGGDRFVGVYPEYYISFDDMTTKIPFAEKFLWAKTNDVPLYNELSKLVIKSNHNYTFNENKISAYYSANISITKEIGNIASISFNATNFINNMAKVHSSWANTDNTLFGSSYIPAFYYGLSLRLKL